MSTTAQGYARMNGAGEHLIGARYFHGLLVQMEYAAQQLGALSDFPPSGYFHIWRACVVTTVMSLEANVHDLLTAPSRGDATRLKALPVMASALRLSTIERYDYIHRDILSQPLDKSQGCAQDAANLIKLRDEVVHYKTEYRHDAKTSAQLEGRLRGKFSLCPFHCANVFFPERCVSADSAGWCIRTAERFMKEFARATGCRLNV